MPVDVEETVIEPAEVVVPDTSAFEAKIQAQTTAIAERDATIGALTAELSTSKAANYDLVMSMPKDEALITNNVDDESNDSEIDIDDLFS